jgi:hypothetical protein
VKRSRFTVWGIERPFPWLLLAIGTAEVVAATAVCVAAIGGVLFAAHVWMPTDLHDVF